MSSLLPETVWSEYGRSNPYLDYQVSVARDYVDQSLTIQGRANIFFTSSSPWMARYRPLPPGWYNAEANAAYDAQRRAFLPFY